MKPHSKLEKRKTKGFGQQGKRGNFSDCQKTSGKICDPPSNKPLKNPGKKVGRGRKRDSPMRQTPEHPQHDTIRRTWPKGKKRFKNKTDEPKRHEFGYRREISPLPSQSFQAKKL